MGTDFWKELGFGHVVVGKADGAGGQYDLTQLLVGAVSQHAALVQVRVVTDLVNGAYGCHGDAAFAQFFIGFVAGALNAPGIDHGVY